MTIHDFHKQSHIGWDNFLSHIPELESGKIIVDSSRGPFSKKSPDKDIQDLNFDKVNPAVGPIYVKGPQPGDNLELD